MPSPMEVHIVALPETAGSALYGMKDVLMSAGSLWQELVHESGEPLFTVSIVSPRKRAFDCGNGIPVRPDLSLAEAQVARIVILPELWLGPDESIHGRHQDVLEWVRRQYHQGASIYTACSGSVLLAESGLLDGCPATSHWGYRPLFERQYPQVRFNPESNLVFADDEGRIVTAGGTTSWHDLALHIIARYGSPAEAMRIAKVYLLKWHAEGQLPYAALGKHLPHDDALVQNCEAKLKEDYRRIDAISRLLAYAGIPERTLKRRFKLATGSSLLEYIQNLRIEEAKRLLENHQTPVEEISYLVGYEDASFFRRLFKRLTGLQPNQYRRIFRPIVTESGGAGRR